MGISAETIYRGPSIHARRSVVQLTLHGFELWPLAAPRRLLSGLFDGLPGLLAHSHGCGAPECFDALAAGDPRPLAHLFEHVCIEIQNLAGAELACVRADQPGRGAAGSASVPYEEAEVCVAAARWTDDLLTRAIAGDAAAHDLAAGLRKFLDFARARMLPVQDRELIKRARALDVPAAVLTGRVVVFGHGRHQQRLSATKTTRTNVVSNDLAANKDYTRRVLGDLGLPIPRYQRVGRGRAAADAARRIGFPVVVKPNNGNMGQGVSIGLRNRREVRAAYRRAREFGRSVLVEELVEGFDYRMLVIDGRLHAASKRVPAHVVGDGHQTVEELVAEVNADPRRGEGPTTSWTKIELDERADALIAAAGYTRQSVLPDGEWLYLRRNANTSDGGTAIDVTDEVHPDNRDIAERAARAIGLDVAGVDLLTADISTSMWENGGKICEINSRPGIRKHLWPAQGRPRDVATPIIEMLFPPDRPSRVPIVALIGTGAVGLAAQMLADVLARSGHHVGLATKQSISSGGRATAPGALDAPSAARRLLLDPAVGVAVLEITAADVWGHGIGFEACDLAVVVNSELADASALADAIAVVARSARGGVVIDARDPLAGILRDTCGEAKISRVEVWEDGSGHPFRIPVAELVARNPGFDPGRVVQSAVLSAAAAHLLGQEPDHIHRSLCGSGGQSAATTGAGPGRRLPRS